MSSTGQKLHTLDEAAFERLADAIACAIYEEGCFAYFGGDVGMVYWRDLRDEAKASRLEDARQLIREALGA